MLILASGSPQRRAILEQVGIEFEVVVPGVAEVERGEPAAVVVENALIKARAVATGRPAEDLVLGVDTVIAHHGEVIGKPADAVQARQFMQRLAGQDHQVLGGMAVIGPDGRQRTDCVATDVRFRPLSEQEIDAYVATNEWQDRSGGYAIQQCGATLVERIDGDYLNIVGLSVVELLRLAPELRG